MADNVTLDELFAIGDAVKKEIDKKDNAKGSINASANNERRASELRAQLQDAKKQTQVNMPKAKAPAVTPKARVAPVAAQGMTYNPSDSYSRGYGNGQPNASYALPGVNVPMVPAVGPGPYGYQTGPNQFETNQSRELNYTPDEGVGAGMSMPVPNTLYLPEQQYAGRPAPPVELDEPRIGGDVVPHKGKGKVTSDTREKKDAIYQAGKVQGSFEEQVANAISAPKRTGVPAPAPAPTGPRGYGYGPFNVNNTAGVGADPAENEREMNRSTALKMVGGAALPLVDTAARGMPYQAVRDPASPAKDKAMGFKTFESNSQPVDQKTQDAGIAKRMLMEAAMQALANRKAPKAE